MVDIRMIWYLLWSSGRRIFSWSGVCQDVKIELLLSQFPLRPKGQSQVPQHFKVSYWTIQTGNDNSLLPLMINHLPDLKNLCL